MNNSTQPLLAEFEYPETRDSYSGPCSDTTQGENNDQASNRDQAIPSENLSLIETESDLLCSASHRLVHPAYTDLRQNCVRLLKILPIQADRTIRCRLQDFSLDDKPTYTAISYTWGSQYGSHEVFVNDHPLLVPKNLWRFLNSARAVGGDLSSWLWVDMLSINQADICERGHQVSLMPAIFRTANLVNVWLGPAYLGSDAALIVLARSSNHWKSPGQRRKVWASHGGPGIWELCQRPYWMRLWVYQELRVARQIRLMCGTRMIAWDQFELFLSLAKTDLSAEIPRLSSFVPYLVDSPAMRMVKLNSKSVDTHLWSLMQATQHLRCTDIRDRAYAILGASTKGHGNFKPDYDLPIPSLINKILLEVYKLYPPESLEEALVRCHEVEDVLSVPRGTVFTIRGQRGNFDVPSEADLHVCRLGPPQTSFNLWWTAFYGHVGVQRPLLNAWRMDCFASDSSVDEDPLTWQATAVARNLFRTCAMEMLSLDPRLSHYASSFKSRYDTVKSMLQRYHGMQMHPRFPSPQEKYFDDLLWSGNAAVAAQSFNLLLAPGGFLASGDDAVVDLLRAYAVHHDKAFLLFGLHKAGFVDDVTESRFLRFAYPPPQHTGQVGYLDRDPFLGINAEEILCHHEVMHGMAARAAVTAILDTRKQIPEKNPSNVVRLPLLSYLASRSVFAVLNSRNQVIAPQGENGYAHRLEETCISYFLQHRNCDMDVKDENGWTPLIWAARYSNLDFISMVLDPVKPLCNVNYSDPNDWTAFEHAAAFPNRKIMSKILAAKSFDHNAVDSNGRTRLLRAIENCDVHLAEMLLKAEGCDPNIADNKGRTSLTLAVSQAALHFEDSTTMSGMQPNATSPKRPDHAQQRMMVELLLHHPVTDTNLQDSSGRSALMIACALGLTDIVQFLIWNKRCDRNIVSPNGDTAYSLALSSGYTKIADYVERYPLTRDQRKFDQQRT
jgi:ankyrin repeat protein